jgi:tripartite-type tricarboxylate transporter receptor subunit TctC
MVFARRFLLCVSTAFALAAGPQFAAAQAWPSKTITAIVPFNAGSTADVISRTVFDHLAKQVGRPIIVENRGGAGGTLGAKLVANAAPDGYTILATGAMATAQALYASLPYDTVRDFTPVIPLGRQPLVVVTSPSKGFKTLGDLIATAKARPGALNFASAGAGSVPHLAGERLRLSGGFEAQHVPFRGGSEPLTEVLAGRIDYYVVPLASSTSLILQGKLLALAVTTSARSPTLPQVPTTKEAGLADSVSEICVGLFVSAKTPPDIIATLHRHTEAVLRIPVVQENLARLGVEPMSMSQEEYARYFRNDVEATVQLAKAADIRLEQ